MMHIPVPRMIFILLLLSICRACSAELRMGKPGCESRCGHITIPYPFGIGVRAQSNETCYYNEWFQIDCNKSTEGKPFLRRTNLEVLNISINGEIFDVHISPYVLVNSPISFFCEGIQNSSSQVANLTGSPFIYSDRYNTFTAVSCGSFAWLHSALVVGGCKSVCDRTHTHLRCDTGINCCSITVPPYLTVINATLGDHDDEPTPTIDINCTKFAFLANNDWLDHITNSSSQISGFTDDMKRRRKVPVSLEWSITYDTMSFGLFKDFIVTESQYTYSMSELSVSGYYNPPTTLDQSNNTLCYISTSTAVNGSAIYCSCRGGLEGNPYLHYCKDIDECKDNNNYCAYGECVNYIGGFRCEYRQTKGKLILVAGLSSSLGLLLLLVGTWFGYKFLKKRNEMKRKKRFFKRNGGLLLEQQLSSGEVNVEKIKLFKSQELEKSTDNFNVDRILGQGGQGTVYKGMLEDGRIIAVKRSKIVDESQLSGFINEVVILSQINHRNVVQLLGCCLETEVPLLVYEYIPNGTLSKYITEQIEDFPLTWKMRIRIATEIAGALSYLHYTASFPIYHRDIKSTNILLDEKYRAKVADFGTSRSIAIDQTHLTTSLVHGTFGYLDPEYFQSSQFTEKSDVYSFGVVLVELLTGQKPISFLRSEDEGRSLATYFILSMHKDRLFEIVDPQVLKEGSKSDITIVANLARRCLNLNGRQRPTMREVTTELEGVHKATEKSSDGEQNYEEVEILRTESIDPWEIASSSTGTGPALDGGHVSSFHEIPLLNFTSK